MSLSAMVIIYQGQFLNEKFKAKLFMPVPIELIVVSGISIFSVNYSCVSSGQMNAIERFVSGWSTSADRSSTLQVIVVTLISLFTGMHEHYGSEIMGEVPTGWDIFQRFEGAIHRLHLHEKHKNSNAHPRTLQNAADNASEDDCATCDAAASLHHSVHKLCDMLIARENFRPPERLPSRSQPGL